MRWPWQKKAETRASYTDSILDLQAAAVESTASARATAALEACAGWTGRAFASAEVQGPAYAQRALTPGVLELIGRNLVRSGEDCHLLQVLDGRLVLRPVGYWHVRGSANEEGWRYFVYRYGSTESLEDVVPGDQVVHCRYAVNSDRPWLGVGPLQQASLAGKLSGAVSEALADELATPRGYVLPLPETDGEDDSVDALKRDLRKLRGALAFVESMSDQWGSGDQRTAPADWETKRLGANPPAALGSIASTAFNEVCAAVGLPAALFSGGDREAYRQALHSYLSPLAKLVEAELSTKLDAAVKLDFGELYAGDVMGRARAFASLVNGGMEIQQAAAVSGVLQQDD